MRKTYKSSNVRFCMEDENQRRTWEYLQSLTRKDSSYGKALSDAFVLVLDGKVPKVLSRKLNDALSSRLFYAHFDSHRDISHFKSSCFCELFF